MDGIQFLASVREQSPETVRVMLTGQADVADAVAAVNQGNIFRFLVKPCAATILAKVIETGIDQYRAMNVERQMMHQTLLASVEVLVEILSVVEPVAFSRATRMRRYVRNLLTVIRVADSWRFEAAAVLSQIGWITLPPELVKRVAGDERLSDAEKQKFAEHPLAAARILEKIPRLEVVAGMVEGQLLPAEHASSEDDVVLGGQMLRAVADFDMLRQKGTQHETCLQMMRAQKGTYNERILTAMSCIQRIESEAEMRTVSYARLAPGMILEEDITARTGLCLLGRGQEITPTILQRLNGFEHLLQPALTLRVRVPGSAAEAQ